MPNLGSYRTTRHDSKLLFHVRTTVAATDILSDSMNVDYVIDVVGLLTGMSKDKDYERDGKVGKMVVLELTSEKKGGVAKCYVGYKNYAQSKHKICSSIQGISIEGATSSKNFIVYSEPARVSLEDDFMKLTPKTDIETLTTNDENGTFVVMAIIRAVVDDAPWWYVACRCGRTMIVDPVLNDVSIYYCDSCDVHSFNVTPRYKVRVEVEDHTGSAIFVLFEREVGHLFKKSCVELFLETMRNPQECVVDVAIKGKSVAKVSETLSLTPTQRNLHGEFTEVSTSPKNDKAKATKIESTE